MPAATALTTRPSPSAARMTGIISASSSRPRTPAEMADLRAFTRDLMQADGSTISARGSIGSPSITGTPTIRMSIFSCAAATTTAQTSSSPATTSAGACASRAEDLVTRSSLARRPEHEIRNALEKEVEADRWTRLDVEIRLAADEDRRHRPAPRDARRGRPRNPPPDDRTAPAPGEDGPCRACRPRRMDGRRWRPSAISATSACAATSSRRMHRAFTERGEARGVADYVIDSERAGDRRSSAGWSTGDSMTN